MDLPKSGFAIFWILTISGHNLPKSEFAALCILFISGYSVRIYHRVN